MDDHQLDLPMLNFVKGIISEGALGFTTVMALRRYLCECCVHGG